MTSAARGDKSPKLPIGVDTTANCPGFTGMIILSRQGTRMSNGSSSSSRARQIIKLPLGTLQAYNPPPVDAFTARIILTRQTC